jgi:metallophosphoesterase (TIGR03768 family)
MKVLRRDFLKYCAGSAAALGLDFSTLGTLRKVLAAVGIPPGPTYPIADVIYTTLDRTVNPVGHPQGTYPPSQPPFATIYPCQISLYAKNGYGEWDDTPPGFAFARPDMQNPPHIEPSVRDPLALTLLTFFTMSDLHICDKESPARTIYYGYQYPKPFTTNQNPPPQLPEGSLPCYSGIILYTTHVLDAAVQTINALHKVKPFDFGIGLGDACDNTQYNELRWYIDVIDGGLITPSSGAHLGADSTHYNYQRPYQAAGLDKSIQWYQAVGNHDQFWMGATLMNNYIRETLVGSNVLCLGTMSSMPPNWNTIFKGRDIYMGVVNGLTRDGTVIYAGSVKQYKNPPQVAADLQRRSLSVGDWMNEFFNTETEPVGHGFALIDPEMASQGYVCYSFKPRADMPIKVIVLDDTDKTGSAYGALDECRYRWLVGELEEGQAADELMIICAHIPVRPYAQRPEVPNDKPCPLWSLWAPYSPISENTLLATLHEFPNLVLWIAGHVHRNTITPQPAPGGNPGRFWEVETPSLRDFPQQFRHFEIVRNSNDTLSIFVFDVDPAVNPEPGEYGLPSPAFSSRSCAVGAQQIFGSPAKQGPLMDPVSCVYNAELVIQMSQLSQGLQDKINQIKPSVGSLIINGNAASTKKAGLSL